MSDPTIKNFIKTIADKLFEDILMGRFDVKNHEAQLDRLIGIAEKNGVDEMVAWVLGYKAVLYSYAGSIGKAREVFQIACDRALQLENLEKAVSAFSNMAYFEYTMGNYARACQYADRAYELVQDERCIIEDMTTKAHVLSNNTIVHFALQDYEKARVLAQKSLTAVGDISSQMPTALGAYCEARTVLAELELAEGNLTSAWSNINLARESAESGKIYDAITYVCFTQAHIASKDSNHAKSAQAYYEEGLRFLEAEALLITQGRILLHEARYLTLNGQAAAAQQWIERAEALFSQIGANEDLAISRELIHSSQ